ncbi:hemagglutinin repeat-containing protein [Mycoavidus sp. SF9855]|uniref:hemagglutinin repeat-containing protein n=1 Tax=Mycoavidus sp. SF9855 TaxID=2968475 RepID=UPI00211C27FA|nr:hemagglutinin repeat-containing protein [Mycoavidus sp. SF9855]UUM22052.1 hemagglutinin repeat-containing protein [Mycoavidus sp. SF9855]
MMLKVVNAISAQQIPTASTSSDEQRQTTTDAHTAAHPPTVDIAPPNSAGISYNSYQELDVTSSGIVLQNGPAARMILHKTIGYRPSKLEGIVKIAGQPAQLAFSNANGIHLWGCNFLNTSRIIFAAGEPMVGSNGNLDAFLVSKKGQITINSVAKLKQFDQIDLIAYSIKIDGELQANTINISTGKHQVNYTKLGVPVIATQPAASIQSGQNLSKLNQVSAGWLKFTKNAKVRAHEHLRIKAALLYNSSHQIQSSGDVTLEVDRLDNAGTLRAQRDISLEAKTLKNKANALIDGRILTLNTQEQLKNQGVIQGSTVTIGAQSLINDGLEDTEEHQAGVIMARRQLTIGAQTLHNQEHGLMHSDGELTIGGSLNTQRKVDSSAQKLTNTTSSTIESRKKLSIQADHLDNQNGQMTTSSDFILRSQTLNNTCGHIEVSGGQSVLDLQTDTIDNTSGRLLHNDTGQIEIVARASMVNGNAGGIKGAGSISGKGSVTVTAPQISNDEGGTFFSDQSLKIKAAILLDNQGALHGRDHVWIEAGGISNGISQWLEELEESEIAEGPKKALLSALAKLSHDLFRSIQESLQANPFKTPEYLITGNTISISTQDGLINKNAVIFAQNSLEIGAKCVNNFEQSVLYSGGNLAIGGQLDTQLKVKGTSEHVFNYGSTIDALGDLVINSETLLNANEKFKTKEQIIEQRDIHECQDHHTNQRYDGSQIGWRGDVGGLYHVHHSGAEVFCFTNYNFTRRVSTTVVTHSEPGKIQAGGAIRLSGVVINDKSRIIAGGALSDLEGGPAQIDNRDANGQRVTTDQGTSQWSDRDWHGGMFSRGWSRDWSGHVPYHPAPVIEHHNLNVAVYQQHTAVDHQAPSTALVPSTSALTSSPFLNSGLQRLNLDPNQPYLIQTDSRFTRNSDTVSSNFLLNLLNLDPQRVPKRLGDGFYEQQLIRDQIIGLTGHYYLSGYRNPITEFKALMHRGANWAKQHNLTLGIEPTPQQIAALTASPVWLVNQSIKLPNGSEHTVMMPKLYLAKNDASPVPLSGSLISANAIELHSDHPLKNAGTMISRGKVNLNARHIDNQRGAIVSLDTLSMEANDDIDSRAGQLIAVKKMTLKAGHDIHLQSQTQTTHAASGSQTALDGITQVQAEQLEAYAESDIHLAATQIKVDENASLEARGDLTLGTATVGAQHQLTWDARNGLSVSTKTEIGSLIQTGGTLELKAGRDIHAVGAHVNVGEALSVKADRDINVAAAHEELDFAESHYSESSNVFSSSSELTQNKLHRKQALGSTFSGDTVKMEAGHDLSATGSNIIGTHAVGLYADNDINLNAAQQIEKASHYSVKERSGLLDSGSLGFTIGERQQKDKFEGENTPHIGTVIGSVSGYIQAIAGREYHQSGSQLVAPEGNIEGKALKGTVVPVYEQGRRWQHNEWHQSGLTVSVSAPVIAAAQTGQQMLAASTQVSDPRMHALAAGAGALAAKNAYDAIQADPKAAGGVTVSAMIGESHQEFQQTQLSTTALGSAIKAGGTVRLDMKGLGEESTLAVIGSQIEAKHDVELNIEGPLSVEAALNTFSQHSERHNQSSAVGMAATFGTHNSMGACATISLGRGHTDGIEVTHTHAQIKAGHKLMLNAQSDVHLKGAQLSGQQVEARIEGDLEVESVQNTNNYKSHYHSISGSATVGPTSAVSINFSQQKIDSTYRSVAEQTGIQAGDGGFQIKVKGDTKLVGGVIASTDRAIAEGKNQFVTATLVANDITNQAKYDAHSISLGIGYSSSGKNVGSSQSGEAVTPAHSGNQLASRKGISPSIPIAMSASGTASSTTKSTISGAQIVITDETRHKALTGQSSEDTLASLSRDPALNHSALAPIFNQAEIEAGFEIVQALGREVNTFIQHRAKDADHKIQQAKNKETLANENALIPEERRRQLKEDAAELRVQAKALNDKWGPGGLNRRILTALTAAASGNVTGTTAQFVQSGVVNLIQQQGASYIGKLVQAKALEEGCAAHATLHALVAAGGAVASNQSVSASAIGGATSSLLTNLFKTDSDATQQEQEAKRNLLAGLVTGIAAAVGQDPSSALTSASIAIENNWLASEQRIQKQKEVDACGQDTMCSQQKEEAWTNISETQNIETLIGVGAGLTEAGMYLAEGLVELIQDPIAGLKAVKTLITDKELLQQLGEVVVKGIKEKIARIEKAGEVGGSTLTLQAGRDMGNLLFEAGSTIMGAVGVVKVGGMLGKTGIRLGRKTIEDLGQLNILVKSTELGKTLGQYSAIKLGPLTGDLAGTFSGGRYTEVLLKQDTVLYRAGIASRPFGDFFSQQASNGVIQSRIDKAILPTWPNGKASPIDSLITVKVPAGTKVYVGEVSSQGSFYIGGAQQIIVPDASMIDGIKILDVRPLK